MERNFTIYGKPGTLIKVTVTLLDDKTSGEKLSAIDLTPVKRVRRFSIVGDYYENNRLVSCGQCLTDFAEVVESLTGERKKAALEFLAIWDRWHLNDLRAGTIKQGQAIQKFLDSGWRYDYTDACKKLEEIGLYEDRGYKYGHKWLYEPLPKGFEGKIGKLITKIETTGG